VVPDLQGKRVAILGIGNELNGDDGAGVSVARWLQKNLASRGVLWKTALQKPSAESQETVLVVDAGPAPENFTGLLRRFQPEWVIIVDAADIGQLPGTATWLELDEIGASGGSTHVLSPGVMARFLADELSCQVMFIGIQPENLQFGSGLSEKVKIAVRKTARQLKDRILSPRPA
jgi:hydrogenase 3 maturation protease